MNAADINRPEIVAEVMAVFRRYERALVENDIELLNQFFWSHADVVRFGIAEQTYGIEALRAYRRTAKPVSPDRRLQSIVITTFGSNAASVCTEFTSSASPCLGRQSRTWVRMPDGWRIVAAHVSEIANT